MPGPGYAVKVHCDMERVCGCDEGSGESVGWMRVADINMTRDKENCPAGFRKVTTSGKRMCGGQSSRSLGIDTLRFLFSLLCYSPIPPKTAYYAQEDAYYAQYATYCSFFIQIYTIKQTCSNNNISLNYIVPSLIQLYSPPETCTAVYWMHSLHV